MDCGGSHLLLLILLNHDLYLLFSLFLALFYIIIRELFAFLQLVIEPLALANRFFVHAGLSHN